MKNNDIYITITSKHGQYATVEYERDCYVYKNAPPVRKHTVATHVRIGAAYDALKSTWERRGVSSRKESELLNQGLRGMHWYLFPIILESDYSDQKYLRLELDSGSKFNSYYILDGDIVDRSDVEQYLSSKERGGRRDDTNIVNVKLDNVIRVV